jgi:hypothetical protein
MKVFPHFDRDDTAYVTIHLSKDEHKSLAEWMHIPAGQTIQFPHAVRLFKRGFGWYRLDANNLVRVIEKLKTALALINKWHREHVRKMDQEIALLLAKSIPHNTVRSYQSDTHSFQVHNEKTGQVKTIDAVPASQHRLQALANKFGRGARQ